MRNTLQLTLCLTHDCTLRCRYCYAGRKYQHAMSRETAERGIDIGLKEARRTHRGLDVSFFGGEPLLEWELLQHCYDYASRRGKEYGVTTRFSITTNGTLLTQERLDWAAGRDFLIGLSVDGSAAMHNTNRCYVDGRGSHKQVAQTLQLINETPGLRSQVVCVVTPNNHHLLREGVQWLHEHYQGKIGLNFDFWSKWSDEQFDSLCQQLDSVGLYMLESYRQGKPLQEQNIKGKIMTGVHRNTGCCNTCYIGEQEIAISVDGNFFPCSRLVGVGDKPAYVFGNVQQGIDRARQHFIIASRGNTTPECKLCELRQRCTNSCGCTNQAASGHLNQVSPFLCNLEQKLINLADELAGTLYAEQNPHFMRQFYGL